MRPVRLGCRTSGARVVGPRSHRGPLIVRVTAVFFAVVGLALLATPPRPASAHPMGNFTINHYSALTVNRDRLAVLYVVDMAEIPTYQELGTIRPDHSTTLTPAERAHYTATKAAELLPNLTLGGTGLHGRLTLEGDPTLSFPPGMAGLPTLRLELQLSAPLGPAPRGTLAYRDDNYKERIGWKEIIAIPGLGVSFEQSSVPAADLSNALHRYPPDRINDPPRVSDAALTYVVGGVPAVAASIPLQGNPNVQDGWGSLAWVTQQTSTISSILQQRDLPLGALLTALIIAFSVGAAHALSPGHGKTVVAAYLVGSRGTALHAILLGLTVTVSHTFGVFLLGLVVLYLANYIVPEALYPWLTFGSGAVLVAMGVTLFVQRYRAWKAAHRGPQGLHAARPQVHNHVHDAAGAPDEHLTIDPGLSHAPDHTGHPHDHADNQGHLHADGHVHLADGHTHPHDHDDPRGPHKHGPLGRAHTHIPADGQPVTLGNLLVLGITGGIIPCPSALVILLVAVASAQVGLGLTLILAFSIGLAVVLMSIGLLMVYSRNFLNRFGFAGTRFQGVLGRLPMVSAIAVCFVGVLLAVGAFNIK